MEAKIKKGIFTLSAPISTGTKAPLSKTGRSRSALSTNGWIKITDENGIDYHLSFNLINKDNLET